MEANDWLNSQAVSAAPKHLHHVIDEIDSSILGDMRIENKNPKNI
jgi:hypothetical protein